MMARRRTFLALVLGLAGWLAATGAEAASVKSVQTGALVTMSPATRTVSLSQAVDATKAFVVCSSRTNTSNPADRVTCELSATAVTITAGAANGSNVVQWYVVEFEGGVSVQRGLRTFSTAGGGVPSDTTLNVTLNPAVDLSKSFVLISERMNSTSATIDESWTVRAQLTATNNLELFRTELDAATSVAWQVVQMDGASVRRGLTTLTGSSITAIWSNPDATLTNSFLVMSRRGLAQVNGVEARYQVMGEITDLTTLTFTRASTEAQGARGVEIAWEVVTLTDGSTVNRGASNTDAVTTQKDVTIPAVDTARTIPLISIRGGLGTGDLYLSSSSHTATITSATNLHVERGSTAGIIAYFAWQTVQFFKCSAAPDIGYVAASAPNGLVPPQASVYWSSPNPVLVLRKTSAFAAADAPAHGTTYLVNDVINGAATVVYNGSAAAPSFTNNAGLANGTTYYYKVFPKTGTTTPCYAAGTGAEVSIKPEAGPRPAWSYTMVGGSMLKAGIAGEGTIHTSSNASRVISLNTTDGSQSFGPAATTQPVQSWLTWLPITTGLAYWALDDGGGTAADASGGNHGTLIGGPTWVPGRIGQGLSFSGASQYVNVPHSAALNAYPLTVAVWLKTNSTTGVRGIVNKYVANSYNGWNLFLNNGNLCAWYLRTQTPANYVYDGGGCTFNIAGFNDDQWHHVTFTVDASGGRLYVDGVQQGATQAWTGTPGAPTTTQDLHIGHYPGAAGGAEYFVGALDEVRLYSRALSAEEVAGLYAATASSVASVVAADQAGKVYAVDTASGVKSWEVSLTGADFIQATPGSQMRGYSDAAFQATYADDVIFVGTRNAGATNCGTSTTNNKFYAIRPTDGTVLWTFNEAVAGNCPNSVDWIVGMPSLDYGRNRIYVTSRAGGAGTQTSLWVINGLTGGLVGSLALGHLEASPTLSWDGTTIYVGNTAGTLYAVDANALTVKWSLGVGAAVKGFMWEDWSVPGRLYFSTASDVRSVQDNGASASAVWTTVVSGPSTLLLLDKLYLGSSDGKLHQINPSTGVDEKQFPAATTLDGTTVGDVSTETGGEVFVGTAGGRLYKIPLPLP